ncbi:LAFA_0D03444g1_1 [Lachancea sp. 'fantastica']|nr:LAFA_0D03444g1_1 [Lachancea sp. 'fantastica']
MDSKNYLKAYGWKEGEGLKPGALKKPILVKHKNDKKGLGSAPGGDDGEMWWETLFDGHLKNLNVNDGGSGNIKFEQKDTQDGAVVKDKSPLYRWFVKGEVLKGTIETELLVRETTEDGKVEKKFKSARKKSERKKDERSSKKASKKSHKKEGKVSKKSKHKDKKSSRNKSDRKDKKERKEKKRNSKKKDKLKG